VYRLTGAMAKTFADLCRQFVMGLALCAFCGSVCLTKTLARSTYKVASDGDCAPYLLVNASLPSALFDHGDPGFWNCCHHCSVEERRKKREKFRVFMSVGYLQEVLGCPPLSVQSLSLLDVATVLQRKGCGFAKGTIVPRHLLESPLVRFGDEDVQECGQLLDQLLATHPLVQEYQTCLELH